MVPCVTQGTTVHFLLLFNFGKFPYAHLLSVSLFTLATRLIWTVMDYLGFAPLRYVYILSWVSSLYSTHLLQTLSSNSNESFIPFEPLNDQQFPMVLAMIEDTFLFPVTMKPSFKFSPFIWKMDLVKVVQDVSNYSEVEHPKNTFFSLVTFEAKHGHKIFTGNINGLSHRQFQLICRTSVKLGTSKRLKASGISKSFYKTLAGHFVM